MLKVQAVNHLDGELLTKTARIHTPHLAALCWTLGITSIALQSWSIYLIATILR